MFGNYEKEAAQFANAWGLILDPDKGKKEHSTASADENALKKRLEAQAKGLKDIADDTERNYDDRIKALQAYYDIEKLIAKTEMDAQVLKEKATGKQKLEAQQTYVEKSKNIELERLKAIRKLQDESGNRDYDANISIKQGDRKTATDSNNKIISDTQKSLADRITAQMDNERLLVQAANEEREKSLRKRGLTNKEIEAIEMAHQQKLWEIQQQGIDKRKEISLSDLDTKLKGLNKDIDTTTIEQETRALIILNKQFENGEISIDKYNEKVKKLQNTLNLNKLISQKQNLLNDRNGLISLGMDTTDIDNQIAQNENQQENIRGNQVKEKNKYNWKSLSKDDKDKFVFGVSESSINATTGLLDAAFDRQMQQLQMLDEQQQKNYDREKSRIEDSTMDAVSKANRMRMLDKQHQIEKDQNEKKERKLALDKAKFDKDANITKIITNTARAIMEAAPNPWEMAAMGVAGAAELAIATAAPLPRYEKGTDYHPGGKAIVGEKGQELITTPSGKMFLTPSKAALMDIPKGSEVLTHEETMQWLMQRSINNTIGIAARMSETQAIENKLDNLTNAMNKQTKRLERVFSEQKRPIVNIYNNAAFDAYIDRAVRN